MKALPVALLAVLSSFLWLNTQACIWDSDTLAQEKSKSPKIAEAILGKATSLGDPTVLQKRITELEAYRRESDPAWWNEIAAAYIRLGEPQRAAVLLEAVALQFPDDYGIHANLGTAYHLLGRYADAEKEIARDLEINPEAHFGLEKFHLALLQYLSRDVQYKREHVYLDEYSIPFLYENWSDLGLMRAYRAETQDVLESAGSTNDFPAYRLKWNLAANTNRENGVIYMASLNPREPACFVMLGIECLAKDRGRDLNLAIAAFRRAIELGSTQSEKLRLRIATIEKHVQFARGNRNGPTNIAVMLLMAFVGICLLWAIVRWLIRPSAK